MVKYAGFDVSFAKSGVAVIEVINREPSIIMTRLIESDKGKKDYARIDGTITEIKYILEKYNSSVAIKEQSVVSKPSTATPVIKTHAVFEHVLSDRFLVDNVYPSTIKAWARRIIGKKAVDQLKIDEPKKHGKLLVGKAVEKYYGDSVLELLYTPRGRYIDDIGDAIALMTLWLEKQDLIDVLHRFKEEK